MHLTILILKEMDLTIATIENLFNCIQYKQIGTYMYKHTFNPRPQL